MKKSAYTLTLASLLFSTLAHAAPPAKRKAAPAASPSRAQSAPKQTQRADRPPISNQSQSNLQRQLSEALAMVRSGQYQQAAPLLYTLSRRPELESQRMQIKYILGVALSELKLNQIAAFQFVDVIRQGSSQYVRQAIERLSLAADNLGDDTLLNYAVSKVRLEDFPANQKEVIYYRLGEIRLRNGQYNEAAELFSRVSSNNRYATNAKFNRGLALLEANKPADALPLFQAILKSRGNAPITDINKVAAQMAMARTFYQMKDWDRAIEIYREIPRDSEYWHDALFESSWALLQSARFRSTLSNLQSLHSAFYEDSYIPESLLVRSIVYLLVCKFDETDKTLTLFEKTYGPVRSSVNQFLENTRDPAAYFNEIDRAYQARRDKKEPTGLKLPYMVAKSVLDEGNIKRALNYLRALNEERTRIESMSNISRSALGSYSMKVLASRFKNSKTTIGELVRAHLKNLRNDLNDSFEQASFIRYEMINGRKEILRKKIAGKEIQKDEIDENVDREFYVVNGFEYWPFDGEYWIDEIGNYHYLGQQSCE